MEKIALIEKLQETTGVTREEAQAALEEAGWDALDALQVLERQGKIQQVGRYTSKNDAGEAELPPEEKEQITMIDRIFSGLALLLQYGNRNTFCVDRENRRVLALPITVFVLLIIFMFWIVIPLLIVGLFFGYHYSFVGPDINQAGQGVNQAINRVGDAASSMAQEFTTAYNRKKESFENDSQDDEIETAIDDQQ